MSRWLWRNSEARHAAVLTATQDGKEDEAVRLLESAEYDVGHPCVVRKW
jgi:hypothetical protein